MNEETKTPACIGIIMDGNRRWAKEQGLPGTAGHMAGYEKLKEVLNWTKESGIKYLIVYAFSTENWKRNEEEVSFLMNIFRSAFDQAVDVFKKNKASLRVIGERKMLPPDLQEKILKAEEETAGGEVCLVLAISYGGRPEILSAVKELVKNKKPEEIANLTEKDFAEFLYTKNIPDPDLIIRTSGEQRTSNFLPWQSVYTEWFFTPTYWPAFTRAEFTEILEKFSQRERRLGK